MKLETIISIVRFFLIAFLSIGQSTIHNSFQNNTCQKVIKKIYFQKQLQSVVLKIQKYRNKKIKNVF